MSERLNNEQIFRKIVDVNSDVQRYLDLAPSFKPNHPDGINPKETPSKSKSFHHIKKSS